MERKVVSPPTYRRAKSLGNILVRARVPSGFPIWREYLFKNFQGMKHNAITPLGLNSNKNIILPPPKHFRPQNDHFTILGSEKCQFVPPIRLQPMGNSALGTNLM